MTTAIPIEGRRAVEEWCGRTPDTAIPARVKLRILARQHDCCDTCGCTFSARLKPEFDHNPALINGGENREALIDAVCKPCHRMRTKIDVETKSRVNRIKAKHLGITKPKHNWAKRPMRGYPSNAKQINEDLS